MPSCIICVRCLARLPRSRSVNRAIKPRFVAAFFFYNQVVERRYTIVIAPLALGCSFGALLKMASVLYCSFSALLGAFFRCALVFGLGRLWMFFQSFGFRSRVWHLIALLFLVPPAAKEGKGDCEFPLCPPWILLLPLCNAGHYVPRGGYGERIRSFVPSIIGGLFYGLWLMWWR